MTLLVPPDELVCNLNISGKSARNAPNFVLHNSFFEIWFTLIKFSRGCRGKHGSAFHQQCFQSLCKLFELLPLSIFRLSASVQPYFNIRWLTILWYRLCQCHGMHIARIVLYAIAFSGRHEIHQTTVLWPISPPPNVFPPNISSNGAIFLYILLVGNDYCILLCHFFACFFS